MGKKSKKQSGETDCNESEDAPAPFAQSFSMPNMDPVAMAFSNGRMQGFAEGQQHGHESGYAMGVEQTKLYMQGIVESERFQHYTSGYENGVKEERAKRSGSLSNALVALAETVSMDPESNPDDISTVAANALRRMSEHTLELEKDVQKYMDEVDELKDRLFRAQAALFAKKLAVGGTKLKHDAEIARLKQEVESLSSRTPIDSKSVVEELKGKAAYYERQLLAVKNDSVAVHNKLAAAYDRALVAEQERDAAQKQQEDAAEELRVAKGDLRFLESKVAAESPSKKANKQIGVLKSELDGARVKIDTLEKKLSASQELHRDEIVRINERHAADLKAHASKLKEMSKRRADVESKLEEADTVQSKFAERVQNVSKFTDHFGELLAHFAQLQVDRSVFCNEVTHIGSICIRFANDIASMLSEVLDIENLDHIEDPTKARFVFSVVALASLSKLSFLALRGLSRDIVGHDVPLNDGATADDNFVEEVRDVSSRLGRLVSFIQDPGTRLGCETVIKHVTEGFLDDTLKKHAVALKSKEAYMRIESKSERPELCPMAVVASHTTLAKQVNVNGMGFEQLNKHLMKSTRTYVSETMGLTKKQALQMFDNLEPTVATFARKGKGGGAKRPTA